MKGESDGPWQERYCKKKNHQRLKKLKDFQKKFLVRMPLNSLGTNGIKINQMIENDPSFFILNSDEFKKIKAAEVKRPLTMPAGISMESENGNGDSNTISTQKNNYFVEYPSGSHHEITLGLIGIHRSSSTTKNCSFGNSEQKYDKSESEKLEDAKTDKDPAVAIRRPTATAKPQVGQKKSAVEFSQLAGAAIVSTIEFSIVQRSQAAKKLS